MTTFELTLNRLQVLANESLSEEYSHIWIQGCNRPKIRLVITLFNNSHYSMIFRDVKNFRNFREDGDPNIENELLINLLTQLNLPINVLV